VAPYLGLLGLCFGQPMVAALCGLRIKFPRLPVYLIDNTVDGGGEEGSRLYTVFLMDWWIFLYLCVLHVVFVSSSDCSFSDRRGSANFGLVADLERSDLLNQSLGCRPTLFVMFSFGGMVCFSYHSRQILPTTSSTILDA
jgi:hypothetical protein